MPCSGRCPPGYDVAPHFTPVLQDATDAVATLKSQQRGRPAKQLVQAEQRLQDLQDAQQKLVDCLAHKAGWLMFFYCQCEPSPRRPAAAAAL